MGNLLKFFALFWLLSSFSFGEDPIRAVPSDPDGYTDVHEKPTDQSDVIYKLNRNEEFFCYPKQNSDWWKVFTYTRVPGYVRKDKIKEVETGYCCYPPAWDGIVPGYSLEKDLVTIFGNGFVDKTDGYQTRRIYLDPSKSLKLIITIGYNVVESVTITSLIDEDEKDKYPISTRINKDAGFGKWGRLKLGSSVEDVRNNLGNPGNATNKNGQTDWTYPTDYRMTLCYIGADVTITFSESKIVKVVFNYWPD
jgi:hypothetical protein